MCQACSCSPNKQLEQRSPAARSCLLNCGVGPMIRLETKSNALQVKVELQADCYAGAWAYHAHKDFDILEPGDAEEALRAASAIGDDTLQRKAQGYVRPDAFTHGSSKQRVEWFKRGFESGDIRQCNTFE